ncbi:hypothetical protein MBLNU13_g02848t1 [Cladosporium sp. NU13]
MDTGTDLLICGAGPTGSMLALRATRYDIEVRIIDSKADRIQTGRADGLHSRLTESTLSDVRLSLNIDQDAAAKDVSHPVQAVSIDNANHEIVRAKYVVGCDGGHSTVRQQLDIRLEGERTTKHFGVVDIVPLTDLPDICQSCAIHSNDGSIMTVPREERLVRVYVQLAETESEEGFDGDAFKPEKMVEQARKVLEPYTLDFESFLPEMQFIVILRQWVKLGAVISDTAHRDILSTYNSERRPIALRLIELDKQMSEFYSQGPSSASEEYQKFRDGFSRFLSGVSVTQEPNALIANPGDPNGDNAPRNC